MIFSQDQNFVRQYVVSQEVYDSFQLCSKDYNPLHTDEQFALQKGFPERVMYGNILNGFISHFIGECLPTKDVIIHSQSISFKNPVFLNEKLEFEAVVSGLFDSVNAVEFKYKFIKPDGKIAAKVIFRSGCYNIKGYIR